MLAHLADRFPDSERLRKAVDEAIAALRHHYAVPGGLTVSDEAPTDGGLTVAADEGELAIA